MSDKYPIVKGLPPLARGRSEKYSWSKMEVNDSFFFKAEEYLKVCMAASQAAKRHGHKYRISKLELRVQRVK